MNSVIASSLPAIELAEFDGEPCARDTDIGERLGFERPRDIRKLIERNLAEIEAFGVCATVARTSDERGGRPATEYWLTEEQALLVASKSDAPNAAQVRHMLIKVFVAWRRGHLVPAPTLTPAEMFLQNAQAMVAIERRQIEHQQQIDTLGDRVGKVHEQVAEIAQAHVILDKMPVDCESIVYIRKRINRQYGLSDAVVDKVMRDSPYAPTIRALVRNNHVDADGSHYAGFAKKEVTAIFKRFVGECQMVTATMATHPFLEGRRFNLRKACE
jgi:hypothetical protein